MTPPWQASRRIGIVLLACALAPGAAHSQALSDEAFVHRLKAAAASHILDRSRAIAPEAAGGSPAALRRALPFRGAGAAFSDRIINDRSLDAPGATQSEVSIAAAGSHVVAVWNDGQGLVTLGSTIGYAYSTDGGATWTDGGAPLATGGVGAWTTGPVVTVNEKTGTFYLAALCEPTYLTNGVGVTKGTFIDGELMWDTPRLAISANRQVTAYDQPWIAADSVSGNLYLTYARFNLLNGTNRIDYQRNTGNNAVAWSAPSTLSSPDDVARVRAPRIAVGPEGVVWAAWHTIGTGELDFLRVRRSTNLGAFFTAEVTAASLYANFGSGAPGFSRGFGLTAPSLAVDRTYGSHRGRVYLAWNESLNYFDDPLGTAGAGIEEEPNDTPAGATPFTPGQILTGVLPSSLDGDCWSFHGVAGETFIFFLDAGFSPSFDAAFRLIGIDGVTHLAFSESGSSGIGLIVFTLPRDGTYFLRVQPFAGVGAYVIFTGVNGKPAERARDQRDVFVSHSDDGSTWSSPSRVNDDPAGYDDWLPEVAVGDFGRPYVVWYDWRDSPPATCGGVSHVYLARSEDGGDTRASLGPVTAAPTAWTSVVSGYFPNQGFHLGAYGNSQGLHLAWADGRLGDPDIFAASTALVRGQVDVPPGAPSASGILDVHPIPADR